MTIVKYYKSATSELDYTLDWSDFLTGGDTIVSSTWTMPNVDIALVTSSFNSTLTTAWISGGKKNISYDITNSIVTQFGREDYRAITIFISEEPNELSELINVLRLHLGDTDSATYRYMDEWLMVALETAIKALQRWWGDRYIFNTTGDYVLRNPTYTGFTMTSPPEIQDRDIRPIILMASILVKSGSLEANSWNVGSWRDAEIAVSNIEGNKAKQFGIGLDWEELKMYILPPTKRLSTALRIAPPSTED